MSNELKAKMNYWQGREMTGVKEKGTKTIERDKTHPVLLPALKEDAAEDLFDAACNLVHQAQTMRTGERAEESKKLAIKWFSDKVKQDDVTAKLKKLHDTLKGGTLNVRFSRNGQYLGAYDREFHIAHVVQLGKPFLYKRFSWGEKVMTFIHEMSHVILETVDKGLDGNGKAKKEFEDLGAVYGPYARLLAQGKAGGGTNAMDAITNAENWGYFIVSHHTYIDEKKKDALLHIGKEGREFTRLDDVTLLNLTNYVKNRPGKPGPEVNVGDFGADWTKEDGALYDMKIIDAPKEFTTRKKVPEQKPKFECPKCKKTFPMKSVFDLHEC
jgi:hypothetical protein